MRDKTNEYLSDNYSGKGATIAYDFDLIFVYCN